MASREPTGKLYYTIGEVSRIAGLPSSVLRYWETEFGGIRPPRNRSGKRLYRQADIDKILQIKKLLYEDRFTIKGARRALKEKTPLKQTHAPRKELPAEELRQAIKEILEILDK
jgi:DNA-binding transcriptional MerR regulator